MTLSEEKAKRNEGVQKPNAPSISLPKGGGAIRGIGEKFAANPVTGTGSISVPLATSPGRSEFGPQLSLSYDSGAGSGSFGFGWSLSLPAISRKTDKGLPQYQDAQESDIFILSGAEDLVPVLNADGSRFEDTTTAPGYTIHRYRPRIEGLFARIERWTRSDGDMHWRSISKDNILTLYGKDTKSRITDPEDSSRIFSWLICETRDDKGNAVLYEYKPEDGVGVDLTQAHERNRGDRDNPRRTANRYIKRIRYGNRTPLLDNSGHRPRFLTDLPALQVQNAGWMFEVVFDYGEHDTNAPTPDGTGDWDYRADPFSSYRAGFEVRTTRLCQRVLMFHHFPDEEGIGNDCLVRSTDFTYSHEQDPASARNSVYTFLRAVTQSGYKRGDDGYLKRSLPSLEFEYSQPVVQDAVEKVDAESLENLPSGLGGGTYQWTDLHGEGIPGILNEQGGAWFYKRNLSPINVKPGDGPVRTEAKFAPVELVDVKPNLALAGGQAQFMDLAGDGQPDLVVFDGPTPGLYEHDGDEGWQPFRPFTARLNRDTRDPNLKFVDLDGDGHADVLISEDDAFVWHASLAEKGFGMARRVAYALDEEKGPRLVFADGTQSVYLADLSGDGLTDLVRIRNAEVCYWPNLGYGRFGAKVTMDQAPHFDSAEQFDHKRIRLADIDGSGTTDIIYLHRDGVRLYFNQSGNSWSTPQSLAVFPRLDSLAAITATDLLGNGTACLVWSSPLPGDATQPMRYVNLMGGQKPHLLVKIANNLGAETRVQYAPSTKFYLQDKRDGKPWITRLPFPVHVVERVETYDNIGRNHFVTRYAYHHGYFDGEEREFRGFGKVEQWDTEEYTAPSQSQDFPTGDNIDESSHVPPVNTKTWFHTGVYLDREHISRQFEGEYYREPGLNDQEFWMLLLPDTILPTGLTLKEEREACRALKGMMLRQEVYADDAPPGSSEAMIQRARTPYTIVEQDFAIRTLQPRDGNRHAVLFTHAREVITYHYERNPADPRIQHALTLEVDDFGNVLKEAAIGYGRRRPDAALPVQADRDKQTQTLVTYTENLVTTAMDDVATHPGDYRTPLPSETRTYELTGYTPTGPSGRFRSADFVQPDPANLDGVKLVHIFDSEIQYEDEPTNGKQRRLIEHVRTLYRTDDLSALLPPGEAEPLALPGESYKLAFTPGLLAQVFQHDGQPLLPSPADVLGGIGADQGGYVDLDGDGRWWIPSGRVFLSPDPAQTATQERVYAQGHFFLPHRYRDPFGQTTAVTYDAYDLLLLEIRDPAGNRTTAGERDATGNITAQGNDYRVLQPRLVMEPNRNRSAVAFDALGLAAGTAIMGKPEENLGDSLDDFEADLTEAEILNHLANPLTDPHTILGSATTRLVYDLFAYQRTQDQADPQPAVVYTLARETHNADLEPGEQTKVQYSFSYSDGFGREVQKKVQAEPGPVPRRGATGKITVGADGQPEMTANDVSPRWVGSGWTVFNNKGKPVRQYEPFFTDTHRFEFDVRIGVSPVLFYDPLKRVVASLQPNHTYEKIVFDPWQRATYDVNDTVAASGAETGDPRTDPDIAGFVHEYFKTQPATWETWHEQRQGGGLGAPEQAAANKAVAHANTPTTAYFDTLGRPFLTIAHNKVVCPNHDLDGTEDKFHTRIKLDIEGNQRVVRDASVQNGDAQGRIVMRYTYDMLGNRSHQASMEAGERWMLNDAAGHPIRAWDSRGFMRRMFYDELRRPTGLYITEKGTEWLAERTVYGESLGDAANHRTRVHQVFDGAGVVFSEAYDFKGNLLRSKRELLPNYSQAVDWEQNPVPNDGTFVTSTTYDALNRPLTATSPDGSVYRGTFNEANLLDRVEVNLRGAAVATPFITNIDYNAKGQRERIDYGNGTSTFYTYDPLTFRLVHLKTTRPAGLNGLASEIFADPMIVQNLHYTYDPVGNITRIEDVSLQPLIHNGEPVEPICHYTYDAIYRLVEAKGREHMGQTRFDFNPPNGKRRDYPFIGHRAHPNDPQAMRNYTEQYQYDAVGNFEVMRHTAKDGNWTRHYEYNEDSLIETGKKSNRLTRTTVGNGLNHIEEYTYTDAQGNDVHGCITALNSMQMVWDFKDQLQQVDLGGGGTAYYVYDGGGQRVRKVIERQSGTRQKERIYLGEFEVYRAYNGNGQDTTLERETLHIHIMGSPAGREGGEQQRIALVETRTLDTAGDDPAPPQLIRCQFGNHLGSASLELDVQAQVISYEEYTPYGSTSYQAVRSQAETSKRYRYTGKERDEESGLYYLGARYYAPWLGRWTKCDPMGIGDGTNLFVYTRVNPLVHVDSSGTDPKRVVRTNNYRELLRESIEENENRPIDIRQWRFVKSLEAGGKNDLLLPEPIATSFESRVNKSGRTTTKLENFTPPGWEGAGDNAAACFRLALAGANMTAAAGEDATGGGGVILYESTARRIKTDKTASDLALGQIKRHIESGRAVLAGVNEPANRRVVNETTQPVTDHFVDIYGYETDEAGNITSLFAKDNAVAGTAEIRFIVNPGGAITKPAERRPSGQEYINQEYQLSEVRFHTSLPYTGDLKPTNDAGKVMYWPVR